MLELIALPTPGELLMSYCGFLVYQHRLNWPVSILISSAGAIMGITIAYFLGRLLGDTFFKKYGSKIHMGPDKMEKLSGWFTQYGNKLLIVAYFIPGVRHVTGYFSGISRIPYRKFAVNAYIGAFIWSGTFISLGKILGPEWKNFHGPSRRYLVIGGVAAAIALILYYLYQNHRAAIYKSILKLMKRLYGMYHSLGSVKVVVTLAAIILMGFLILTAGLIQDYMANEFNKFNTVTSYVVHSFFSDRWSGFMNFFPIIAMPLSLVVLTILALAWTIFRGIDKWLEVRFLLITAVAGQLLQEGLSLAFHRLGPITSYITGKFEREFPNEQTFLAVVVFGAVAYLLLRHAGMVWLRPVVVTLVVLLCLFTGISKIFFRTEYPSDIVAGYEFGVVWLSLNVILLEVQRKLPSKVDG